MKSKAEFSAGLDAVAWSGSPGSSPSLDLRMRRNSSRHAVSVTSLDGLGFNSVRVELHEACPDMLHDVPQLVIDPPASEGALHPAASPSPASAQALGGHRGEALAFSCSPRPAHLLIAAAVLIRHGAAWCTIGVRSRPQGGRPLPLLQVPLDGDGVCTTILGITLAHDAVARDRWGGSRTR